MKLGVDEEQSALINEVSKRLNDNTRRIRVLEERLRNLDTQVNTAEQAELLDKNQTVKDAQNVQAIALYPWLFTPVAFVILSVMAFSFVGDGARDAADPYSR